MFDDNKPARAKAQILIPNCDTDRGQLLIADRTDGKTIVPSARDDVRGGGPPLRHRAEMLVSESRASEAISALKVQVATWLGLPCERRDAQGARPRLQVTNCMPPKRPNHGADCNYSMCIRIFEFELPAG